jgi:hypothetical protein
MKKATALFTAKLTTCLFLLSANVIAQSSVNTSGGDASSADGSMSFTIGQVDFSNYANSSGEINLGVQQPFEILLVSVHENALNWHVDVYPNPTVDKVFVRMEDHSFGNIKYELYDATGRLLLSGTVEETIQAIEMERFSPATYLLKLSSNHATLKTFRLIKN